MRPAIQRDAGAEMASCGYGGDHSRASCEKAGDTGTSMTGIPPEWGSRVKSQGGTVLIKAPLETGGPFLV